MDATMGSIAPTGLKGKLAALEDFISMQNEELAAQRQEIESLRGDKAGIEEHYQGQLQELKKTMVGDVQRLQDEVKRHFVQQKAENQRTAPRFSSYLRSVGKTADRQSKLQLLSSKPSAEFSAWASVHQSSLMAGDDALSQVAKALKSLKENDQFHGALEQPPVFKAVRHWAGIERLKPEECEEWQSNSQLMFVLAELRRLEHYCRAAGMKVPLEQVLAGKDELPLPDGRRLRGGEIEIMKKETDETEDLPDLTPVDPRLWRKTFLWQIISAVTLALVMKISLWYQEEQTLASGNASMEL
ncbi:unnamed protein product [Cladocopium goreaui]|uniref:Alpha-ketoglutarate-dependent dioxygenase alkB-like 3 n=1 Tax=Cladocopium goreaui TaxID=2562237 RepID=A0A9P1CET2_9DINO|nr:unnamed protein product [Cladocopium goreaui]